MRGRVAALSLRAVPFLAMLGLMQCRREAPPPPPEATVPVEAMDPWSFHLVGGLLVITGEMAETQGVTLKGTTLNEVRTLPFGPVRWELLRPPPGEVAELRTSSGNLLMKLDLNHPAPPPADPLAPVPAPRAAPPKLAPPPLPQRPVAIPAAPPALASSAKPQFFSPPAPPKPPAIPLEPPRILPAPRKMATTVPVPSSPSFLPPPRSTPPVVALPPPPQAAPKPLAVPKPPKAPAPPAIPEGEAREWPGAGEGLNLLRGPKGERRICMTFDGGSTAEVALDVLDALKSRGIRTTIFLTGDFIRKYPDLVRRMDREGHELGNHTLNHPHLAPSMHRDPRWTRERFQQELLDADRALFKLLGRPFDPYWRAPYGEQTADLRKWAEELGYRHVGWSEGADTLDWATTKERRLYRTGNAILDKLKARMDKQDGDGLIVLMHLGSGRPDGDRPAQVLGPFLDRAILEGWHFVPIGDYVKGLGKPRWEPVRRVALLR